MNTSSLLRLLTDQGIGFTFDIPAPGGGQSICCDQSQVMKILNNRDKFIADFYGVSLSDYLMCYENGFNLNCSAITSKGKQCKNFVPNGSQILPKEWSLRNGEYCVLHSGDNCNI